MKSTKLLSLIVVMVMLVSVIGVGVSANIAESYHGIVTGVERNDAGDFVVAIDGHGAQTTVMMFNINAIANAITAADATAWTNQDIAYVNQVAGAASHTIMTAATEFVGVEAYWMIRVGGTGIATPGQAIVSTHITPIAVVNAAPAALTAWRAPAGTATNNIATLVGVAANTGAGTRVWTISDREVDGDELPASITMTTAGVLEGNVGAVYDIGGQFEVTVTDDSGYATAVITWSIVDGSAGGDEPDIDEAASVVWVGAMAPVFVTRHAALPWVSANHRRVMIVMADGEDGSEWTPTLGANDFFAWSEELNAFDGLVYAPGTLADVLNDIVWENVPTTNVIGMYGLLTASTPIALADVLSVARLVQGQGDGAAGNAAVTPLRYLTSQVAPAWGPLALADVLAVSRMVPANGGDNSPIYDLFNPVD